MLSRRPSRCRRPPAAPPGRPCRAARSRGPAGRHLRVVDGPVDGAQDTDRRVVQGVRVGQAGQGERRGRGLGVRVVDEHLVLVVRRHRHHLQITGDRVPDDTLGQVAAEPDGLAVLQPDHGLLGLLLVLEGVEGAVVEDVAVLVDLDQGRALVGGGLAQHLRQVLAVGVDRPGHERRLRADRQRHRVEGRVQRAHRRRLGDLPDLGGRRVLALGQTVDPVVEQQDLEVDVAPQRVDQVVAADGQRVTVTRDDPHRQVAAGAGQARGDGRGAAVDGVHPVGVHVVREPGGAADARDEDDVLLRQPQLGHEALHRGEDGVVAAAGAPAHFLVGLEVLHRLPALGLGDEGKRLDGARAVCGRLSHRWPPSEPWRAAPP